MRSYKFRAFDKRIGKMIQTGIQFNNTTMELACIPDLILMQATGLSDKQGKEIYEGDLLKLDDGRSVEVMFSFCMFKVSDGYFTTPLTTAVCPAKPDCKVIGNIYENVEII